MSTEPALWKMPDGTLQTEEEKKTNSPRGPGKIKQARIIFKKGRGEHNKMAGINTYLLIITLNVIGLNSALKGSG